MPTTVRLDNVTLLVGKLQVRAGKMLIHFTVQNEVQRQYLARPDISLLTEANMREIGPALCDIIQTSVYRLEPQHWHVIAITLLDKPLLTGSYFELRPIEGALPGKVMPYHMLGAYG